MPPPTTLSRGDTAWLHMDSPTNLMVVTGFFRFAAPLDPARLEATLEAGFLTHARFRQRIAEGRGFFGRTRWVDHPEFRLADHLTVEALPSPGDDAALTAALEARMRTPLDPARPLWEMRLYQGYAGGSALLFRIHHCIADGIALLQVLLDACDPIDGAAREAPRVKPRRPWYWWALLPLTAPLWALDFLRVSTWLVVRPKDAATIYKGALDGTKRVAWTPRLALADVKALSQRAGCKINDVLMALVAGALTRYAAGRGQPIPGGMRALVPVNRRSAKDARALGNAFALVSPTLPVGDATPVVRLGLVKRRMDRLKRSPEPLATVMLLGILGSLGVRLHHRIQRFLVAKASLVMTNVPGPKKPLAMAGVPIVDLLFWVPMFGPTGVGVSIFTYADTLRIGVVTDQALVPDPQALADAIVAELAALGAALPAAPGAAETPR